MTHEDRGVVRVIGEVMIDTVAIATDPIAWGSDTSAAIADHGGGSAANLASWLAHLGAAVELIACVGVDPPGEYALDQLARHGVALRVRRSPEHPTGRCLVIVTPDGERTMLPDPGANLDLRPDDLACEAWSPRDHIHVSGYTLMRPRARDAALQGLVRARALGAGISVDASSSAPLLATGVGTILQACQPGDLLFANAEEAHVLSDRAEPREAAEHLADLGLVAIIKRGAGGAVAAVHDRCVEIPAHPVRVIDSTGAGDAFAAGFIASWRSSGDLSAALDAATRLAARAVGRPGARP
jgi:sugar/nucleoside kinase (ribokinase family)